MTEFGGEPHDMPGGGYFFRFEKRKDAAEG